MNIVLVFLGGGLGCVLRYLIGLYFQRHATLPWATFVANLSACIIFALVVWISETKSMYSHQTRLLLITGFCGGLSTFSAFGFETYQLMKTGATSIALLNIAGSVSLCIFIFWLFKN